MAPQDDALGRLVSPWELIIVWNLDAGRVVVRASAINEFSPDVSNASLTLYGVFLLELWAGLVEITACLHDQIAVLAERPT